MDEKECPRCREVIKRKASVCRHCGRKFTKPSSWAIVGILVFIFWLAVKTSPTKPSHATVAEIPATVAPASSPMTIDDQWYKERQRPKSANLRAYEDAVEDVDGKMGTASAVAFCGIQDGDWYSGVVKNLEGYRNGPYIGRLFQALTMEERKEAQRFDKIVHDTKMRFALGSGTQQDCRDLATMPFVYRQSNFSP